MEIDEKTAEILITEEKIFRENFLRFMRLSIKNSEDEDRVKADELSREVIKLFKGEKRTVCLFVFTYMIASAFGFEEYNKIDELIGNYYMK